MACKLLFALGQQRIVKMLLQVKGECSGCSPGAPLGKTRLGLHQGSSKRPTESPESNVVQEWNEPLSLMERNSSANTSGQM